jgi:hypothetical protein
MIQHDTIIKSSFSVPKGAKMADRFNMSGDFRGAIINIKSTLTNVQQSVGDIRTSDETSRKELESLIGQLSEVLQNVPAEHQEEAQAVAETAKVLVDTAKAEKPNKTMLQISGEGLRQAAQNLAEVMPTVLTIAGQIVMTITKLTGVM